MSGIDIGKASPTPQHLIVEYTSAESILSMRAPSIRIGKYNIGGLKHLQVMRYVYTLVLMEDVYFQGRPLPNMPGVREMIVEWIKPGQQIVSVPNGRTAIALSYSGKKNVAVVHASQRPIASVPTPFIPIYGEDPARSRILYGDPRVPFTQRGDGEPTAAAYYNSRTRRFEIVQNVDRATVLENFLRRFGGASALAG